jgi:SAM-dependent MidA family methyltransferase
MPRPTDAERPKPSTGADEPDSVASALSAVIHRAIAEAGGWLPFDRFMALALYQPGLGYYANASRKFGQMPSSGSDFVTAPELSPLFGRALAAQVAQALAASGSAVVMEFGAGSGALAEVLLEALGDAVRRYAIVDLSGALRARQQARLARLGERVQWLDALPESFDGVVLGNEVLDAMPVQLLHFDGAAWFERGVVSRGGGFAWGDRPTKLRPPEVDGEGRFVPGTVTEIHPQAEGFITTVAGMLRRGVAIFIDYGFPEAEYYLPQRHGGTLMCHRAHRADADPLVGVGLKDITAHVNFTGIALAGQDAGLDVIGYTSQARFLINCGLGPLLQAATLPQQVMAQRLITEHEMGELFKVIAFARGVTIDPLGFAQGDRTHRL